MHSAVMVCLDYDLLVDAAIEEVVPMKSEPASHTETNNTEPYDDSPGHRAVVDPGTDNSSMYG